MSGVYSNGCAGEFYAQTEMEFDRISHLLALACESAGIPFQIGANHMSPQLSRERILRTKALRPAGFQIILPDWFVPSWGEVISFLSVMAEVADPIPLVLYNPPHAKRRLSPAEWLRITEVVPAVVGIKVPGGDSAWYEAMQPVCQKISVFIPGHTLASGMAKARMGPIPMSPASAPRGAQKWYDLCARDIAAGLREEERILKFWQETISPLITERGLCNMAADKAAAVAGGWLPKLTTRLRWPYAAASMAEAAVIGRRAREALPDFFT